MKNKFSSNVVFDSRDIKQEHDDKKLSSEEIKPTSKEKAAPENVALSKESDVLKEIADIRPDDENIEDKVARKKPGRKKIDPSEKKSQVALTIKNRTIATFSKSGDYRKKLSRYLDDNAEVILKALDRY